jgi:hypothetical protein
VRELRDTSRIMAVKMSSDVNLADVRDHGSHWKDTKCEGDSQLLDNYDKEPDYLRF